MAHEVKRYVALCIQESTGGEKVKGKREKGYKKSLAFRRLNVFLKSKAVYSIDDSGLDYFSPQTTAAPKGLIGFLSL
ncbi:MAG: hypothetical protein RMX96_24480 [Nostoc sp. ChiSLP02]|nr:hypothetical protein [Nostoc sp. DedSLP05]MDZ8097922.1 hypothetical protein [Nostoc sp. DedSLP01]MDZ8187995.1 hypothetical protein [Nostoc sp. ChiSLP02]